MWEREEKAKSTSPWWYCQCSQTITDTARSLSLALSMCIKLGAQISPPLCQFDSAGFQGMTLAESCCSGEDSGLMGSFLSWSKYSQWGQGIGQLLLLALLLFLQKSFPSPLSLVHNIWFKLSLNSSILKISGLSIFPRPKGHVKWPRVFRCYDLPMTQSPMAFSFWHHEALSTRDYVIICWFDGVKMLFCDVTCLPLFCVLMPWK